MMTLGPNKSHKSTQAEDRCLFGLVYRVVRLTTVPNALPIALHMKSLPGHPASPAKHTACSSIQTYLAYKFHHSLKPSHTTLVAQICYGRLDRQRSAWQSGSRLQSHYFQEVFNTVAGPNDTSRHPPVTGPSKRHWTVIMWPSQIAAATYCLQLQHTAVHPLVSCLLAAAVSADSDQAQHDGP